MNNKITMKFIAKKAGVSTATVSSVINNSSFVSKGLTDRVNQTIKKYNYHMDYTASSLRKSKTKNDRNNNPRYIKSNYSKNV